MRSIIIITCILLAPILATKSNFKESAESKAGNQFAECFDGLGSTGGSYFIGDYVESFATTGFDNSFSSCCVFGVWILYTESSFNQNNQNAASYSLWGENFCEDLGEFENQASSVRFAGAPDGYKFDTLNLYQFTYFNGNEQFLYDDGMELQGSLGKSAIVTGCSQWTIFENANYEGACACILPSDESNCYPGFYRDLSSVLRSVSSARKGCFCNRKIAPEPADRSAQIGGIID